MKTFEEDVKIKEGKILNTQNEMNHTENSNESNEIYNSKIYKLESTINEMKKGIEYLNQKRRPSTNVLENYISFINCLTQNKSESPSENYQKNFIYLNKIIENYLLLKDKEESNTQFQSLTHNNNANVSNISNNSNVINNNTNNNSNNSITKSLKKLKKIGVTSEDIAKIPKYKINFRNLPKFGKINDSQFGDDINLQKALLNNNIGMLSLYNMGNRKIKNNSSCIEKQNKDALKLIEQRRQKYKNYSKSTKEKMDNNRLKKYWEEMIRHDIPKSNKAYLRAKNEKEAVTKRFASLIEKEVKKKVTKQQLKAKKLEKEMLAFYRKKERENAENERRKEKMEIEKKKKEEELREQIIQKKRMEYLLKQSDIYSLMMYKHLGAYLPQNNDENENENNNNNGSNNENITKNEENNNNSNENQAKNEENKNEKSTDINQNKNENNNITKDENGQPLYKEEDIAGNKVLVNTKTNKILFQSIRVEVDENQAKKDVQNMINQQRQKAAEFDTNLNKIRKTLGGQEVVVKKLFTEIPTTTNNQLGNPSEKNDVNMDKDLNNQTSNTNKDENTDNIMPISGKPEAALVCLDKPMINNQSSQLIEVPHCFIGELKAYQLKGLRWLDNLYEQGINGILADEMGLGKTIEAISFLAHLAEEKNNWGPFLIIAPNATLYNWQQEFNRFCPTLKVLPYWGALKERKTLRKFFNSSQLYIKSSAFHVCITSYQLVVSDEKVFHKVNWNYMILDEAQAIKNISSQRWNVLLSFNCRNRLLLSGTPIQNSMSELWALLHFIMPNLFDSHEQFSEWFSKDIEAHSQNKGGLNQEQLNRLHKILKPFMLRRIKKDVEHEIGPKIEYEIPCEMTEKQKTLYNSIKEKLSNISDLFISTDSKVKVTNLMNLVMQFRKVCNHPELFERNFGKVPLIFRDLISDYGCSNSITLINGDVYLRSNSDSILKYQIPKMIYDLCYNLYNMKNIKVNKKLFIYSYENIIESTNMSNGKNFNGLFNFAMILGYSLQQFMQILSYDMLISHISLIHFFKTMYRKNKYFSENNFLKKNNLSLFINNFLFPQNDDYYASADKNILPPLIVNCPLTLKNTFNHNLIVHRFYIPKIVAFPQKLICSNTQLDKEQNYINNNLQINKLLYGIEFKKYKTSLNLKLPNIIRQIINIIEPNGLLTPLFYQMEGYSQIELPSFDRLVSDCAKLKKLDELLKKLYQEGHRVLIFCQMTHMIDILEEYMSKMKYTYFRMDGSTNIADRRDMINEFQTNPKIFAFLLSTRAGGLGVNLTGADTVIFYDNDWNPTMDAQATDRAHRIGQTKVVSVYRLITANTIEERILKRAKQKQNVQTTVYSGGAFKADIFKQNDIVKLLYSEEEMQKMEQDKKRLLLELNNGEDVDENECLGNNICGIVKNKKKKGKKDKKNRLKLNNNTSNKKKNLQNSSTNENSQNNNNLINLEDNSNSNNQKKRGIFAVKNEQNNNKKKIFKNAIKLDSSDDENQVIFDDGVHPINFDEEGNDEFNEENERSNDMDID